MKEQSHVKKTDGSQFCSVDNLKVKPKELYLPKCGKLFEHSASFPETTQGHLSFAMQAHVGVVGSLSDTGKQNRSCGHLHSTLL